MKKNTLHIIDTATDIPEGWDDFATSIFLKRKTLHIIEQTNPCGQQYYFSKAASDCSIAVSYHHNLDILTYGFGSLRLSVTIVGIPCSVAYPGYSFQPASSQPIIDYFHQLHGAKLILNSDDPSVFPNFASGATLPSCKMSVRWNTFDEYMNAMRSHYRYRFRKALEKWHDISTYRITDNRCFDEHLYRLYLNVFYRSGYKLEKLSIDFFKQFPAVIDVFVKDSIPIGFVQIIHSNEELMFMFGGMDYSRLHEFDLYINMLLHIVRLGIDGGYRLIDLGQTAEPVKCKLGCKFHLKTLHAAHKNRFANFCIQKFIRVLSYKLPETDFHVFNKS